MEDIFKAKADFVEDEMKKMTRRAAIGTGARVALAAVVGLVVGGVAGYFSGSAMAPAAEKTVTETKTVRETVTQTVTQTVGTGPATGVTTVTVPTTVTVTTKPAEELPWIGDWLSAPDDPGWTQWPRRNPPYKIGLALPWTGNPWRRMQLAELEIFMKALQEAGWVEEYRVLDAGGDVLEQKRNIQQLVEWGADAMIIDPVRGEALIEDIERVTEMGIFTGLEVESPDPAPYGKLSKFGMIYQTNYYKSGYIQGKFVAETLIRKHPPEKRKVAVLRGIPGAPSNTQRWLGAVRAIEEYKDKGVEIVAAVDAEWSVSKAREAAADIIASNPNVRGWVSQGAMMEAMIPLAVADAGLDPSEHVITAEDFVMTIRLYQKYKFDLLIVCNPQSQPTYLTFEMIKCLNSIPARKINYFDPPVFKPEQLYEPYKDVWGELPDAAQLCTPMNPDQLKKFITTV